MARYQFMVVFVITALSIQQASTIECWICNNLAHHWCNDSIDLNRIREFEKIMADCPSNRCVKMSEVTSLFANMEPTISRFCANSPEEAIKICSPNTRKKDFKCEVCDTDGCNGVARNGPVALLVLIPVVIAKLLAFYSFSTEKLIEFTV